MAAFSRRKASLIALLVVALGGVGLGVAWQQGLIRQPNPEAEWAPPASPADLDRWYKTLADDHRVYGNWIDAAELISRPRDELHRQSERAEEVWSVRKKGQAPAPLLGEPLRARKPTVTELIERRIQSLYASKDSWERRSAVSMASLLARWDAKAARSVLSELARDLPQKFAAEKPDFRPYWVTLAFKLADEREKLGDQAALGEVTRWAGALNVVEVANIETFPLLAERRQRPEIAELTRRWFEPKPGDGLVFSDELSLTSVVREYALVLPGVREHVLARLGDRSEHGGIEIGEGGAVIEKSGKLQSGYSLPPGVTAPKDGKFPLRVCDHYAIDVSTIEGAPKFEAWRSESERDAQVQALRRWLESQPLHDYR